MDYLIEIRVWGTGYDETDELAMKIADLLRDRHLAADPTEENGGVARSLISVKPLPPGAIDCSTDKRLERMLHRAVRGARMVVMPSNEKHRKQIR